MKGMREINSRVYGGPLRTSFWEKFELCIFLNTGNNNRRIRCILHSRCDFKRKTMQSSNTHDCLKKTAANSQPAWQTYTETAPAAHVMLAQAPNNVWYEFHFMDMCAKIYYYSPSERVIIHAANLLELYCFSRYLTIT